jgi:hypothetical protein
MNLSEVANRTIELARKVYDYYTAELPKVHPNYPLVGPDDGTALPPPEEKELHDFLANLSEDMFYRLMLIMYLGRGDFGMDKLGEYFEELKGAFGDPPHAASHMIHQAPLADYLADGLEELRKHKINVDKLPLKKTKSRKS